MFLAQALKNKNKHLSTIAPHREQNPKSTTTPHLMYSVHITEQSLSLSLSLCTHTHTHTHNAE